MNGIDNLIISWLVCMTAAEGKVQGARTWLLINKLLLVSLNFSFATRSMPRNYIIIHQFTCL